ncbi:MAG: acyl-CoA dehydrogenase family protein [Acidimicrobiia bacterium]|nr:acyl-CoA dehydrogenase family protein [Acidimicrobiia bacterium]MDH5293814.1 acyl-CoA dehydrogenase family protein [Acidimicrobiia bacterium]
MSDLSFTRPDPHDFLDVDGLLDDEERLLRDTVRDFVGDRILPDISHWWEDGVFPKEMAKEMGALGLFGMHLEGYGCAGVSNVMYGLACRELEYGDSGVRSFVSVQGSLAMFPIWKFGSEEQKETWLPRMAAGEAIGCFGLTEADAGSDPSSMKTHARRDGSDWIINGSKMWITNGSIADVAIVWARTDEGVRGFIVPTDTAGFSAPKIERKASLRASVTSELVLSDVRVPADFVLPGVSSMRGPLSCLNEARFGILWGAVGAARACYEAALEYAGERRQFNRPIASFQLTQQKLVEMMVAIQRSALVSLHIGRRKDEGTLTPEQISFGKFDNVRQALDVARSARSILGGNGITLEYPVFRHMANLETVFTYEGTNEIHTLILGNSITNLAAFT